MGESHQMEIVPAGVLNAGKISLEAQIVQTCHFQNRAREMGVVPFERARKSKDTRLILLPGC